MCTEIATFDIDNASKKLHKATYMAAVCKFRVFFFWFGLFLSVAQLSSTFHYFSCFPALQQKLSLTWMTWKTFVELINLNNDDIFDQSEAND